MKLTAVVAAILILPGLVWGQVVVRPTNTVHWVSDQDPLNTLRFGISAPSGKLVHLLWGDGTATVHTGTGSYVGINHTYGSTGKYRVTLAGFYPVTHLYCVIEPITCDIGNLAGLTKLTGLYLASTSVSGTLSELSPITDIDYLYVYSTSVSGWSDVTLSNNWAADDLCDIRAQDCGWSSASVDQILIDLAAMVTGSDAGYLNIGGTNAARTSASDAAKATLLSNGWTITVNE